MSFHQKSCGIFRGVRDRCEHLLRQINRAPVVHLGLGGHGQVLIWRILCREEAPDFAWTKSWKTQGEHAEHIVQRGGFGRCQDEKQTPWRDADEGGASRTVPFSSQSTSPSGVTARRGILLPVISTCRPHRALVFPPGSADQSALIDQFGVGDQIFYLIGVRFLPVHWTSSQRHIIFSRTGTLPILPPFRANSLPVRAPSRILP